MLLLSKNAGLMQEAGAIPLLAGLLEHLDRFNHLAPGKERDDNEDLAWPGIMGMCLKHLYQLIYIFMKYLCKNDDYSHEQFLGRELCFTGQIFINQFIFSLTSISASKFLRKLLVKVGLSRV